LPLPLYAPRGLFWVLTHVSTMWILPCDAIISTKQLQDTVNTYIKLFTQFLSAYQYQY
jgi:hypothetical protein